MFSDEDRVVERAREIVLNQLSDGPRTRKQLLDKLSAKEIPEDVAVPVVDRFEEVGLVNDAEFAHAWVRSRHTGKGLGRAALRQELRNKGVPNDDIIDALTDVSDDDEFERAVELARKKARSTVNLPTQKRVQRLASMLARKGYPSEMSFRAVRVVLAEERDNLSEEMNPPESM